MSKILCFGLLIIFLSSCARQKVYKKYPDCTDYFNFIEKSWVKKNGKCFFVKEIPDSTKPVWAKYVEPPQFEQRWNRNMPNCLSCLTEKEVKLLFGEPSLIKEINSERDNNKGILYRYSITDELCNEENANEFKRVRCSRIDFSF